MSPSKTKLSPSACFLIVASFFFGSAAMPRTTQAQTMPPEQHRQLARDIFRELIEINTTHQFGSTKAAEAAAARLRAAGFAEADVQMVGARADRGNLVARLKGKGTCEARSVSGTPGRGRGAEGRLVAGV